ncbi:uncharacterized protein LOC119096748 [Pollicipes pollicipes]|uniref:uncharacterized protein LOC119096748 n=1 Tax=Pollicipes pollicipes TaxID=41117 RepID=UPI0018858401|nr:uncharacterized protein LOC119096748 [Pollicipes pollicipes]
MEKNEEAADGGGPGSPGSVLGRLQTRFQQSAEDLLTEREHNADLEKRIKSLTEHVLAANEEKENIKVEQRAALTRLEEAALAERRRLESALCSARQQQQRGQMDLELATEELAALRGQVKSLQMEKVGLARQVRDLELEVKARCRLQQNASDQMVRHNQAKHKVNREVSGLGDWLKRLEAEARAAAELNGRLQLQLRHQGLRLEQLTTAAPADHAASTCPELEELRALLTAGGDDPRREQARTEGNCLYSSLAEGVPVAPPLLGCHSKASADGQAGAGGEDRQVAAPEVDCSGDAVVRSGTSRPPLLGVPQPNQDAKDEDP